MITVILGQGATWQLDEDCTDDEIEIRVSPIADRGCRLIIEDLECTSIDRDGRALVVSREKDLVGHGAPVRLRKARKIRAKCGNPK